MPETPAMNMPEENRIGLSISKHVWISMYGPAVGSLKDAFLGQSVKVLQKCMGAKGEATQAEEEECSTKETGKGEMTPSDPPRTTENIKPETVSPTVIVMAGKSSGAQKYIKVQQMYRIVLLGDTRAGKSSLANIMFGEDMFRVDNTECQAESKSVHGKRITLINTPDFSGPGRSEEALNSEILRCITEFPPGPHAFLIVLKVEKSTEQQQQAVIQKICQYFSEKAFKYAAVVFTQEDQVSDGVKIQDFIDQNKCVSDLVKKCKNRFQIIKKCKQQDDNISNQSQVGELLNTIDQILKENKGRGYISKMLPQGDTHSKSNSLIKLTGPAAESVAKAFTGQAVVILTQGTTNEAQESSKTTDKKGPNEEEIESETANKGHTEKNTKEDGETIMENEGKKGGGKAAGSAATAFGAVAAGAIAAAGGAAMAGVSIAVGSVAEAIGTTATGAGTAGAGGTAGVAETAGASTAGAGGAAEATVAAGTAGAGVTASSVAGYVMAVLAALGVARVAIWLEWVIQIITEVIQWIMWVKENIGVVLLVLVFYSLLLSWFFLKFTFVGTIFLLFLLLLLVIILVAI